MDAMKSLELADLEVRLFTDAYENVLKDSAELSQLVDLRRAAGYVADARKADPNVTFLNKDGVYVTCDSLAMKILEFEILVREDFVRNVIDWPGRQHMLGQRDRDLREHRLNSIAAQEKLLGYKPHDHGLYMRLAHCYLQVQDRAKAYDAMERGLQKFPGNVDLLQFRNQLGLDEKPVPTVGQLFKGLWKRK